MTRFSNRGAVFTTPGTGFAISGQPSPEFGEVNPTYPALFAPFSSPRLFTALNSNVMDVWFFVPGSTTVPAAVSGFGAVFTNVSVENSTRLEFYAPDGSAALRARRALRRRQRIRCRSWACRSTPARSSAGSGSSAATPPSGRTKPAPLTWR